MVSSEDSAATQPCIEEDKFDQLLLMALGQCTPPPPANAHAATKCSYPPVQQLCGTTSTTSTSPANRTPSPCHPRRAVYSPNLATAANSREPCDPSTSRAACGGSYASPPVRGRDHTPIQDRFDEPGSAAGGGEGARTTPPASRTEVRGADVFHSELPSSSALNQKRLRPRELQFEDANPEKIRRISPNCDEVRNAQNEVRNAQNEVQNALESFISHERVRAFGSLDFTTGFRLLEMLET